MTQISSSALLLLTFTAISRSVGYGLIKCSLNRLENCDQNRNDSLKFNITIKTVENKQYIDGTIILEKSLDNTIRANISIERLTNGKFIYLFSIYENKSCDAMKKYWGEFLYDLERMAQMMPGVCPMQKGIYHWHDAPLALEKDPTLASFPFGTLRVTNRLYENNNVYYACLLFEINIHM